MLSLLWGSWNSQWVSGAKVDFDGVNKLILIHPEVTTLDIRTEVYKAWLDWHEDSHDNQRWPFAFRYSGFDSIPGGESGGIFFLINGWKLVIDFNKVVISGVLFSDNYSTAYWSEGGTPLYPAQVSSIVNTVTITNTVIEAADPAAIATEILATPVNVPQPSGSLGEHIVKKLLTVAKYLGLK